VQQPRAGFCPLGLALSGRGGRPGRLQGRRGVRLGGGLLRSGLGRFRLGLGLSLLAGGGHRLRQHGFPAAGPGVVVPLLAHGSCAEGPRAAEHVVDRRGL